MNWLFSSNIDDLDGEIWMPVLGFEGLYEISCYGRVKSLVKFKRRTEIILKQRIHSAGYLRVCLAKDNKIFDKYSHIMTAEVFVKKENETFNEVNHLDGNKANPQCLNLEWGTHRSNLNHAWVTGLCDNIGENHRRSLLKNDEAIEIYNSRKSNEDLSMEFGVSVYVIGHIKRGNTYLIATKSTKKLIGVPNLRTKESDPSSH